MHVVRFLGVLVDDQLCWKAHIDYIYKKATKPFGIIKKIYYFFNKPSLLTLYYSLIFPYLNYWNIVLGSKYYTSFKRIYMLQKRYVRSDTFSNSFVHSLPLLHKLKLLTIYDINTVKICTFVYNTRYRKDLLPECFENYFTLNSEIQQYNTWQANCTLHTYLQLPKNLTTRGQFLLMYCGAELWNHISTWWISLHLHLCQYLRIT